MAASTMMDASYDRKRYVTKPAYVSCQTFVEAEAEPSQPPRARGTGGPALRLSRAPPPRRRAPISGGVARRAVPAAIRGKLERESFNSDPPRP